MKEDILGTGDYYFLNAKGRWLKGSRGCPGSPNTQWADVNGLPPPHSLTKPAS